MFIGHYAAGLAFKRLSPATPLWALLAAALWPDLIWPFFLLLGLERMVVVPGITAVAPFFFEHYPYSHSLAAAFVWAAVLGLFFSRRSAGSALAVGTAVLSHWFLDAVVHLPDMPLWFTGSAKAGLGLWRSAAGTIALECALFAAGAALYLSSTRALDRKGLISIWALFASALIIYAGQFSGATPPGPRAVAYAGLLQWLFILFAFWIERHREPVYR